MNCCDVIETIDPVARFDEAGEPSDELDHAREALLGQGGSFSQLACDALDGARRLLSLPLPMLTHVGTSSPGSGQAPGC
jgi:hypothetical protein